MPLPSLAFVSAGKAASVAPPAVAWLFGRRSDVRATERPASTPVIWIDVSDFLVFVRANPSVTGIQRIIAELVAQVRRPELSSPRVPVRRDRFLVALCAYDERTGQFTQVRRADIYNPRPAPLPAAEQTSPSLSRRLHKSAISLVPKAVRPVRWDVQPVRADIEAAEFRPGDHFVLLSGAWTSPGPLSAARAICAARGLKFSILIHDLIPLLHPGWYPSEMVQSFRDALLGSLRAAETVFTISHFAAGTLHEFMAAHRITGRHTKVLRLGDRPVPAPRPGRAWPGALRVSDQDEYVLSVASIDVRKNQARLISVWGRLHARLKERTPHLVLVGKNGTQAETVFAAREKIGNAAEYVHIVQDADDGELQGLYQHALFTVFPSLSEGWGLPVAESLAHGKLCLASDAESIPEVGNDLVAYFNPEDESELLALLERYLRNPVLRRRAEARIRARYRPREWAETAETLVATLERSVASEFEPARRQA